MSVERFLVVAAEGFRPQAYPLELLEQRLYELLADALDLGGTTLAPQALGHLEALERYGLISLEDGVITLAEEQEP